MGQHNLSGVQAVSAISQAVMEGSPFEEGEKIILVKEVAGWHCYFECYEGTGEGRG